MNITAANHFEALYDVQTRDDVVKKIMKILEPRSNAFDAIVVCGNSMTLISPIVAYLMNKNIVLVRKDGVKSASQHEVEGIHDQRCIFIDDMLVSGQTGNKIKTEIKKIKCSLVGYVLYNSIIHRTYLGKCPCWGKFKTKKPSDYDDFVFK
jgi:adenine/guanine phosphoribosyltransferase-like PRPP-binding protein